MFGGVARTRRALVVKKRRTGTYAGEHELDGVELTEMFARKCEIVRTPLTFNADTDEEMARAARLVWQSDLLHDPDRQRSRRAEAPTPSL